MERKNYSTGATWEPIVGYSRAVRIGNTIEVSGTVAVDETGQPLGPDAYAQTIRILHIIQVAIENLGGALSDVIRTRIFVVNIEEWEAIGRAHGEFFKNIRPATSMVEVAKLIAPEYLVEIEATAIVN
jgi:enamine deaminase RidA (YjgF/YER057c/UK114 family)